MTIPAEQTWMVLLNLLTDLKKRGLNIPRNINEEMRLVKASINFYKTDTTNPQMIKELKRINEMLNEIQETLLDIAETVNKDYQDQWIEKLKKASLGEEIYKVPKTTSRFVIGTPPGFSVARVHLQEPLSEDRVQEIAEEHNLIIEFEEDDLIAVYGEKENIKRGLKDIASFFRE